MSQTPAAAALATSSRFEVIIFHDALGSYRKQTKKDLLVHPLASRFQSCNSTSDILAVLQDQTREFNKSRSGDERMTKWLGPTANVLKNFCCCHRGSQFGILACECDVCRNRCLPFGGSGCCGK
ncbi:hypothetical protein V8E53_003038 [Lactarius tabidus]